MKRLWGSLVLLVVILLACIGTTVTVNAFSEKAIFYLEEATQSGRHENFDRAQICCNAAAEVWTQNASILGALLRHSEADVVETGLMKLMAYAETEDKDEFLALCAELIHDIRHVRDMELPLLRNIL